MYIENNICACVLEKQLERRHTYIAKEDTFLYSGDTKKGRDIYYAKFGKGGGAEWSAGEKN